jgi:iron complex outermembrane receptor protein
MDSEVTKSNDVDLGKRPTTVPAHMASFWSDYSVKDGFLSGLSAGAGVRYIGRTPGDFENTFFVPSYTLVDAALRYSIGSFRLAINANNIFDKEYVSTCFSIGSCYYGNRRTVIGTLAYTW